MQTLPLRLTPGQDLRLAIEEAVAARGSAGFVLAGIGSLVEANLRLGGASDGRTLCGDIELLTLAGSVAANGAHLHASLAGTDGSVSGGHVAYGCIVRTTAEVLLALLPEWQLCRELDTATGFAELSISSRVLDR